MIIIDGTIGKDYWGDDDTIISAKKVREELAKEDGDFTVEINSPGGSVMEGITIHNLFRDYDKGKITVKITGMCASIATYISMGADEIVAHDNSVYMIHNVSSWGGGDHKELRKIADTVEGLTNLLAIAYIKKTGKDKKTILAMMDEESWFYGTEIASNGFAHSTIETDDISSNKSTLLALAKETFSSLEDFVKAKTNKEETQEAEAFLKKNVPTKGTINALNIRLKQRIKEINHDR